ncbi:hypothetical protein H696_01516 [Fonticula alba]|uniref:GB1/RHD3-type G domain-containing protein n=1 Tax=Fonticula alba TaxID=691883 RepID=A0A058ZCH2_FONAL|nr:hypothetical protein H696_01516 [Fonticula alba]KCV72110.1 hypothetical protein H696_01516 [Fonticula alba]|eukprot:XP_009493688.1 hypothetical protein H696_01516 [Fonticula alba]
MVGSLDDDYPTTPVLLISAHPQGDDDDSGDTHFRVEEDAIELLAQYASSQPLPVIAITGVYRTGKSFIMNQLSGIDRGGFPVGATIEPCTSGIWMQFARNPETGGMCLLLDTEGLSSYTKSASYDAKLFALATLLSSFLIYNASGPIDDDALSSLAAATAVARAVRVNSTEPETSVQTAVGAGSGSEVSFDERRRQRRLAMYFPRFLWLARDFSLELEAGGERLTTNEYLERALAPIQGDSDRTRSRNVIRTAITGAFKERSCLTMRRPAHDEEDLQAISEALSAAGAGLAGLNLRPEFISDVEQMKAFVWSHLSPKQVNGSGVTGPMLSTLAEAYCDALNAGAAPAIGSAWDEVCENECNRALSQAIQAYDDDLDALLRKDSQAPLDSTNTPLISEASLAGLRERAFFVFQSNPLTSSSAPAAKVCSDKLEQHITKRAAEALHIAQSRNESRAEAMVDRLVSKVTSLLDSDSEDFSLDHIVENTKKVVDQLVNSVKAADPSLYTLVMMQLALRADHIWARPLRVHANRVISELEEEAEVRVAEVRADAEKDHSRAYATITGLNEDIASSDAQLETLRNERDKLQDKLAVAESRISSLEADVQKLSSDNPDVARKDEQIAQLQQDLAEARNALTQARREKLEIEEAAQSSQRKKRFFCC